MKGNSPQSEVALRSAFSRLKGAGDSGAALVLVLMVVGVMAALIIAYLDLTSRQAAVVPQEVARLKAENLSDLAWRNVVRSLQDEMLAGSVSPQGGGGLPMVIIPTPSGMGTLLFPATAHSSVPYRMSADSSAAPNLIKWSSAVLPSYSEQRNRDSYPFAAVFGPAPMAAAISTQEDPGAPGSIDPSRWNAPRLLSGSAPIPDWVLVSGAGELRSQLRGRGTDPVAGRYAYMVYDEGGLVDLNVCGFPSALDAQAVSAKGTPRLLDLRPLLAAAGMSQPEARAFNDGIVRWRDPVLVSEASYPSGFLQDIMLNPLRRYDRLGEGRRGIVGRQGLIKMVLGNMPGSLASRDRLLRYVGTFSRSLDQPSIQPPQPGNGSGKPPQIAPEYGGAGWDANYPVHSQHLNPPFLQVRVKTPFRREDGTTAVPGEPLVTKRFPLNRLSLISRTATSDDADRKVERLLGLVRSVEPETLVYPAPEGRILTLGEVADLKNGREREANFVELLKASILAGGFAANASSDVWGRSLDRAVLQVAANLIDQFDSDGFPTRIVFNGDASQSVVGVESLPYIYGLCTSLSSLPIPMSPPLPAEIVAGAGTVPYTTAPIVNPGRGVLWERVELWNPHSSVAPVGAVPGKLRLVAQVDHGVELTAFQDLPMRSGPVVLPQSSPAPISTGSSCSGEQFRLSWSPDLAGRFFIPRWVEDIFEAMPELELKLSPHNRFSSDRDEFGRPLFGVSLAEVPRLFSVTTATTPPHTFTVLASSFKLNPSASVGVTFQMQYLLGDDGVEHWVTYDEKRITLDPAVFWDSSSLEVDNPSKNPLRLFSDPRSRHTDPVIADPSSPEDEVRQSSFRNVPGALGVYEDRDGMIRRASGNATPEGSSPVDPDHRPRMLNRPFRSVGEMACAFSGNSWRQLDFTTPESAFSGLLDVFCIAENEAPTALVNGRINLNTRQLPVLIGALSGVSGGVGMESSLPESGAFSVEALARELLNRTSMTPIRNVSELAGRWDGGTGVSGGDPRSGAAFYSGFGTDLQKYPVGEEARHAAVRALAGIGDTRVWNLLLDVIVQVGRYPVQFPSSMAARGRFALEAERRVWVHVAMDRLTGEVLDWQVELPLE